jgi:hypothetical protein
MDGEQSPNDNLLRTTSSQALANEFRRDIRQVWRGSMNGRAVDLAKMGSNENSRKVDSGNLTWRVEVDSRAQRNSDVSLHGRELDSLSAGEKWGAAVAAYAAGRAGRDHCVRIGNSGGRSSSSE